MSAARDEIEGLRSEAARATIQHMRAEALLELVDLLGSYVLSTREAVWRGDNLEAGLCLKRARLTMIEAFATFRLLAPNAAAVTLNGNGKPEAGEPRKEPPE